MRESIAPTYDSRETGPRYHVTTQIEDQTIEWRKPVDDPFVRHIVHLGWRDLLRGLLRRRLDVIVIVGGDPHIMNDVLELDDNTLTPNSTRHRDFHRGIHHKLSRIADLPESPEDTRDRVYEIADEDVTKASEDTREETER